MLHAVGHINQNNWRMEHIIYNLIQKFQAELEMSSNLLNHQATYDKHYTIVKQKKKIVQVSINPFI